MGIHLACRRLLRSSIAIAPLALLCSVCFPQNQTSTGMASATGTCAVSHSGNNDVIRINNCGIGKAEADKIVEMLKSVLANQKDDERDAKLDELLALARRALNPYGTVSTYDPSGVRRDATYSTGKTSVNADATKDFSEMLAAQDHEDWGKLVSLANSAITKYPGWFTPFSFLGEAQFHLCMKEEARASLKRFLSDTENASAYAIGRRSSQTMFERLDNGYFEAVCAKRRDK